MDADNDGPLPDEYKAINWSEATNMADEAHVENQVQEENTQQVLLFQPTDEARLAKAEKDFMEFCLKQVFGQEKGWETTKPLPWRHDKMLEGKVALEWKISKRQAASWWLKLRRSYGKIGETKFVADKDGLLAQYNKYIEGAFESVRSTAVKACLDRFRNNMASEDEDIKYWLSLVFGESKAETLSLVIRLRLCQYNQSLASCLVGMTTDNKAERLDLFIQEWYSSVDQFTKSCFLHFECPSNDRKETDSARTAKRHIFVCLEHDIHKAWNQSMNAFMVPALKVQVLDEETLERLILHAGGLVYYIAGWLLFRLARVVGNYQQAASSFVQFNTLHTDQTGNILSSLPLHVVESREKHHGRLRRVSANFFNFVKLLEGIYKINLEDPEVVWAFKENLFTKLGEATNTSFQLDQAFHSCLPPDTSATNKKELLRIILMKYNRMRAGDFLKKMKMVASASEGGVQDNFTLRSAIVAVQLISSGKTPQAMTDC